MGSMGVYGWWTSLVFVLSLVWTYPSDALVAEVEAAVHQAGVLKSFEASGVVVGLGVALKGLSWSPAAGRTYLGDLNGLGRPKRFERP